MECIVSPKFTCWNLNSNVTVWREGLYKVVKVKRGHGRALILEDWGPYKGKDTSNIPLSLFKEKKGHVRTVRGSHPKVKARPHGILDWLQLWSWTSWLWNYGKIDFYCPSPPAYGFCMAAWAKTTAGSEVLKVATKCGDWTCATLCLILTVLVLQCGDLPSGVGIGPGETVVQVGPHTTLNHSLIVLRTKHPPLTNCEDQSFREIKMHFFIKDLAEENFSVPHVLTFSGEDNACSVVYPLKSCLPGICECDLFGNRVLADAIK